MGVEPSSFLPQTPVQCEAATCVQIERHQYVTATNVTATNVNAVLLSIAIVLLSIAISMIMIFLTAYRGYGLSFRQVPGRARAHRGEEEAAPPHQGPQGEEATPPPHERGPNAAAGEVGLGQLLLWGGGLTPLDPPPY